MLVQSLFVQHTAALRGFLIALAPDFGLVDEVMQEVFLTVSAKAEEFQPGTSFPAWGRAIARFKLMEATRQHRKGPEPFPADLLDLLCSEEPEAASNADAELKHLAHCLGKLAPKARQAVRLRYDEGFFPNKIAERLGWTPRGSLCNPFTHPAVSASMRRTRLARGADRMNARLHEMLNRYLDGSQTTNERQELIELLRSSPDARQEFWKQARLHALLRQFAEENRGSQWANVTALTSAGRGPSGWSSYWGWGVAAATTLALLLMMWKPWQLTGPDLAGSNTSSGQPSEVPVAVLARTVGCVFPTGTPPLQAGAELVPSKLQLEAGLVQLDFFSGARVVLEGPAQLELLAPDHARLSYGKATCEVAVPGRGFRLSAPGMNVLDLGTAFGLLAPRDGSPEVHVLDGKVAVSRDREDNAANAASEVLASAAVRLTSGGFTATSFNPAEFTRTQDLRRKQEIVARTQQQRWETTARALDADSTILVHYTFEGTGTPVVANCAKTAMAGTGGTIIGCRPGEGRWSDKGALEFRGRGDRVLLSVPGTHHSLTLMAWLRVDAFTQPLTALVMSEAPNRWTQARGRKGEDLSVAETAAMLRWELNDRGQVSLNCVAGLDSTAKQLRWSTFASNRIPAWKRQGQWLCWAATHDGGSGESIHYLDGQELARTTRHLDLPFYTAQLDLGNLSLSRQEVNRGVQYAFYGALDEFVLASRAMSEKEIHDFYEQGKP